MVTQQRKSTNNNGFKLTKAQKQRIISLIIVVVLFLAWQAWEQYKKNDSAPSPSGPVSTTVTPAERDAAKVTLSKLKVAESTNSGYKRTDFGRAWEDVDKNSCDTRNDILKRDLTNIKYKNGSTCTVQEGDLQDPYTGKTIHFVRGNGALVDIDHVIALGNVAISGGDKLSPAQKKAIANDPENLLAVDASANRQKGDKSAADWLPSNTNFQCAYVVKQIHVKDKYSLTITPSEKTSMDKVLTTLCG